MRIFLDSSALAKRYVEEPGTEQVLRLCQRADEVILSSLCVPEIISGFNRLRREKKLSPARYRSLKHDLAADVEEATIIDLTPLVIDRTIACLERVPLRALDAVHLASAIESMCDLFLTADRKQEQAAVQCGLTVEAVGASH